jgi:cytochrome c oxidase accessory protein FixG
VRAAAKPLVFHKRAGDPGGAGGTVLQSHALDESLYEIRRKIYSRSVSGWFARWRITLVVLTQLVFYGTAWLQWNGRQALLFDLAARKFYVFGLVFWPQDFIYLAALLVVSALSLFLFTAVAGRLWCGYACPQTVYTEIFMWIERKVEGDRAARMRLDRERGLRWLRLKAAKHGLWIALSLWTGFTFVGYFTPIRQLSVEVLALSLGPWEAFWLLFYGFATYGNAGWMREQVCKYMCPYARFQSAMFDPDTLIVTYDRARGEPRGGRSRSTDPRGIGLGDCVDCGICVQVCPTGIDIRNGLQYECIGCAACIDGCNQVMKKMNYAPGLIRYSTENALANGWDFRRTLARLVRPRVLIYCGLLGLVIVAASASIALRKPVKVDVIRDRAGLARAGGDGRLENVYRLQIMNASERPLQVSIAVRGGDDLAGLNIETASKLVVAPTETRPVPVRVSALPEHGESGAERIEFVITAAPVGGTPDEAYVLHEKSSFYVPPKR